MINLREMIAQAETQSVLFKHENEAIKATLLSSSIPIPTIAPVPRSLSERDLDNLISLNLEQHSQSNFSNSGSPQNSQWQSNNSSSGSLVSMTFDEMIDASCLQITPPSNFVPGNDIFMTSPELFNLPPNPYAPVASSGTTPLSSFSGLNSELSKPLPKLPDDVTAPVSQAVPNLSTIAINFILAYGTLLFNSCFLTSNLLTQLTVSSTPAERTFTLTTQLLTQKALHQVTN